MVQFVVGQVVQTKVPQVTVDAGLKPGAHRFRLVVTDDQGNPSQADEIVVQVREVIVDPRPPVLTDPIVTRPPIPFPSIPTLPVTPVVPVVPVVPVRPPLVTQPVITPVPIAPIAIAPRPTTPLTIRPSVITTRRPRSKKP
jgi:hypothetical protein